MRDDRLGLVQEIAQLEERAKTLGGAGPATRAAAAAELPRLPRVAHDRLKEEAEMLCAPAEPSATPSSKRRAASSRRSPARRALRLRLLPNAEPGASATISRAPLIRGGREEATEVLSKGTQEQLAVLTRIAFADLLIEKGKPASLMLDDALVFADDDRFEVMLEILAEAAQRMQIIILSCRTSAYRGLEAKRLLLA